MSASQAHGAPQPDNDCIVCCDPLDEAQYCEYQTRENGPWFPCMYCKNCMVDSFLNRQFAMYLDNLKTINCPTALAGLLNAGPPIYIKDPKSFPGDDAADPKGEVVALWFSADNSTISGQLKDAVLGAERDALWERLIAETMPRVKKLQAEIESGGKAPAADAAGDA